MIERQVDAVVAGVGQDEAFKLAGLWRLKDDFDPEEWAGVEAMTDRFVREQTASLNDL
jgi:hypothetical protein